MPDKPYFDEDKIVHTVLTYDYSGSDVEKVFHIAYGIDQNFLFGCGVSIASVLLKHPNQYFHFHVFTDSFSDGEQQKFNLLAQQYQTKVTIYLVDAEELTKLPQNRQWTYAIYFRLIAFDYFANKLDEILYLDADIVCKGKLNALFNLNLDDKICAAVLDQDAEWWEKIAIKLQCDELKKGYFNSGVLWVNLKHWQFAGVGAKVMKILCDLEIATRLSYPDQDALNMVLTGKVLYLDRKYNTQFSLNDELKKTGTFINPIHEKSILIHYIGPSKPWHAWVWQYASAAYFHQVKDKTPWQNQQLLQPSNSQHYRYCAKHMFKQGHYFKCLMAYIHYFKKKISG